MIALQQYGYAPAYVQVRLPINLLQNWMTILNEFESHRQCV